MRALACAAAFMGGACWIARVLLEGAASDAAFWAGAVLLAVAVLGLGLQQVPRAPGWLKGIVGVGSVALASSVWATVRAEVGSPVVDAVAGAVAALVFAVLAVRWFVIGWPTGPETAPGRDRPNRGGRATGSHRR